MTESPTHDSNFSSSVLTALERSYDDVLSSLSLIFSLGRPRE
jgi:hypothetical protein